MTREPVQREPTLPLGAARQVDRLCDAFETAWTAGVRPQIEDYLPGTSDTLRRELIRELIQTDLYYRRKSGESPRTSDYANRFPEVEFSWLEETIAHAPSDRHRTNQTLSLGQSSSAGRRFQVLRPHAKGGLGEVFVAEDQELRREVALKLIQTERDNSETRVRFVLEAEITGGLEHPGIVPVYGLGANADGRPFYAMRFIRGESFKHAIECFHSAEAAKTNVGEHLLQFRELLGRFVDVCNAIEYAHSRGVLHRDLKPANIMLGKYGETLVVDWGLAKPVGRAEASQNETDEQTLQPASASDSTPTQMGSAIGTPNYMSPEQAAGCLDQLGPATDVYSLGATLYCLLTGRAPFSEFANDDLHALLRRVQAGGFSPPHEMKSRSSQISTTSTYESAAKTVRFDIPRPLEAICLKAMSHKPSDRYASPRALADDIENWLADEPISAQRDSLSSRVARFSRRHRAWALAIAAALVLVALVSLSALVMINQQRAIAEGISYSSDVRLAQQAAADGDLGRAMNLLERNLNSSAGIGLRGFEWRTLCWSCRGESSSTYKGHKGMVRAVAFSPSGASVATGGEDNTVRLLDMTHEKEIWTQPLEGPGIMSLAFSPDGTTLAAAEGNWGNSDVPGDVVLLDASSGQILKVLHAHEKSANCVAFAPDGSVMATGGEDKKVKIWQKGHQLPYEFPQHDRGVNTVAFSSDSSILAAGWGDGNLQVLDLNDHQLLVDQLVHVSGVMSLVFSPNGQTLAVGSRDGIVLFFDMASHKVHSTLETKQGSINALAFANNGNVLATGGSSGTVKLWQARDRQLLATLKGHRDGVTSIASSPSGTLLVSGSSDRTVKLWDVHVPVKPELPTFQHDRAVTSLSFSPDGQVLAAGLGESTLPGPPQRGEIRLWSAKDFSRPIGTLSGQSGHSSTVYAVAFSPDGSKLASGGEDHKVILWNPSSRAQIKVLGSHNDSVYAVAFSPNSDILASGGWDNKIVLWDVAGQRQPKILGGQDGHVDGVNAVAFSRDGTILASGGWDRKVILWNVSTGKKISTLTGHEGPIDALQFSPGGVFLATAGKDGTIRFWDISRGTAAKQPIATLRGSSADINSLVFSPDGNTLAAARQDSSVSLWNVGLQQETAVFRDHEGGVNCVAFAPDGDTLATASNDGTIKLRLGGQTAEKDLLNEAQQVWSKP